MSAALDIPILYEDAEIVVVDKPAGLAVHPAPGKEGSGPYLTDWIAERFPDARCVGDEPALRPGIVHRLDKATSGVMLVMKTREAFSRFKKLFQDRQIEKAYLALVAGHVRSDTGVIEASIGIVDGSVRRSTHARKFVKPALTEYSVVSRGARGGVPATLLRVFPRTGRTHQIRVHLAHIGHPIFGDPMYGGSRVRVSGISRLMLHAVSIEFTTSAGKRLRVEAPPPEGFDSLVTSDP